MVEPLENNWLRGGVSLGAAAGWNSDEMRLVADLAYALAAQGRNDEALTIFEGLAALAPATAYFQSALGALYLRTDDLEKAAAHLNHALAADPRDVTALVNRAEVAMRIGDSEAAEKDLRASLRLSETGTAADPDTQSTTRARALLRTLEARTDGKILVREGRGA